MRPLLLSLAVAAALTSTVACSGGTTGRADAARPPAQAAGPAQPATTAPDGTQQITIRTGNSMQFTPASFVVRAGEPVELTLRNDGQMVHDFALTEGVAQPVKIEARARQTARGTFTIAEPGTYRFICSVGGHAAAGMTGTITVQ